MEKWDFARCDLYDEFCLAPLDTTSEYILFIMSSPTAGISIELFIAIDVFIGLYFVNNLCLDIWRPEFLTPYVTAVPAVVYIL